jgi:hypothetical protein
MKNLLSEDFKVGTQSSERELDLNKNFFDLYLQNPIPETEKLANLPIFLNRIILSRILFLDKMYQKIINTHGVIMEFGVRWGANLASLIMLRAMYEPYNVYRKIIGFDTFEGFPSIDEKDGNDFMIQVGGHGLTDQYEKYLSRILEYHEATSPIPHIKKFELIKGDATKTIHQYLKNNPETIISFAYFDFDLYLPTKECLIAIKNCLSKGAIIAFDELNYPKFPGETIAFKEVFGLNNYKIWRDPNSSTVSYIIYE